jgi:hypothetical protein
MTVIIRIYMEYMTSAYFVRAHHAASNLTKRFQPELWQADAADSFYHAA